MAKTYFLIPIHVSALLRHSFVPRSLVVDFTHAACSKEVMYALSNRVIFDDLE